MGKHVRKRGLSILLCFAICLSLFSFIQPAVYADSNTGNNSHKYVKNIEILASSTVKESIPGFSFDASKVYYDNLTIYDGIMPAMKAYLNSAKAADGSKLYYQLEINGRVKHTPSIKPVSNTTTSLAGVANVIISSANYGENIFKVRVGTSEDEKTLKEYDEYVFHYYLKPVVKKLSVKAGAEALTLGPEYKSGQWYFDDTHSTSTTAQEVTLNVEYRSDRNVSCYLGDGESVRCTSKQDITIQLKDYWDDVKQMSVVPIRTVAGTGDDAVTTTQYLMISNPALSGESYSPEITEQPKNIVCEKLEQPILSVSATSSYDVRYQWYSGTNVDVLKPISGATEATYQLSKEETSLAGTRYYRCNVTNNVEIEGVGTLPFTAYSDIVSVKTNLTYVSEPRVLKELGSFVTTKTDAFAENYRTEYTSGEKFDLMYISVAPPEAGVTLNYQYYINTENNFDTAKELKVKFDTLKIVNRDNVTHYIMPASSAEGLEAGKYYVFCKVTAAVPDGRKTSVISGPVELTYSPVKLEGFTGEGTKAKPYLINDAEDLKKIQKIVWDGNWCAGVQFKMTHDIALPADWTPIGDQDDSFFNLTTGRDIHAFSGVLDGDGHKLTVAKGGKPLFNYVSDAVIKNLDIYGEEIDGNGLIDKLFADYGADGNYWTGVPDCVTIRNVRLLEGSSTLRSGFMAGSGSGANTITIENCAIQKGVTIGYTKDQSQIGSFVGEGFNGQINDSYSEATVYGVSKVGGLAGSKGQSMGLCQTVNSYFKGTIEATGKWVGGLIGAGYYSDSAPNTMAVSFINCYVDADITGNDYVGGLFGGEEGMYGCINECWLRDSHFYGTIKCEGENVGGIIGYLAGFDKMQKIENNYFYDKSGTAQRAIGKVSVFATSGGDYGFANQAEADKAFAKAGSAKTADEFKNFTVLALLNQGKYRNWVQSANDDYPKLSADAYVRDLTVSGSYKTRYKQGEQMDMSSFRFNATWSDGTTTQPRLGDDKENDVWLEEPFDPNHLGVQTLTFHYKSATATVTVSVLKDYTDAERENFSSVEVLFSLSDDDAFQTGTSNTVLANVPLTVKYFDLANYGLEEYYHYENGKLVEEPTVLHLYITAIEHYGLGLSLDQCGTGTLTVPSDWLTVSGGAGHMYMTSFWNHGANLIYDVNGKYPMKADGSMGATADEIVLKDGDFVDVAMFSDSSFNTYETSGFHFFASTQNTPQKIFRVPHGEELTLSYLLSHSDMGSGSDVASTLTLVSSESVYSGTSIDENASTTSATGEDGKVTLTFATEGTYYVWTKGGKVENTNPNLKSVVVSAPGCATIVVTKTAAEVDAMIDAIDENTVTAESGEAIGKARAAYDALSEKTKSEVKKLSKLERLEAKYGPYREVDIVREMIGALPETAALKLTHRDAVDAAKAAYDKLTAEQKKYLTSAEVTKLNDAVSRMAYLTRYPVTAVTVTPDTITASVKGTTIVLTGYCDKLSDIQLYDQDGNALDVQDGRFTAYGVSYSVDYSGVAKRPVEVIIEEVKPSAEVSATATDKEKAKAAATQITNSDETKSAGLSTAASTELVSTAKDIANAVPAESIPDGGKVEVKAEPSLKIEVKDYVETDEKKELTLDITPVVTYTTIVKNENDEQIGEEKVTEAKIENKDIKTPVTISIPLPGGIVPDDNLYVKHELEGGVEYIKPTFKKAADGNYYIATWQQSSFSVVTFLFDGRSATVSIGDRDYTLKPGDVNGDLPTASKDGMIFTGWSFEIDGTKYDGPYTKLTDDLLTAMDKARQENKEIKATPNFKERPSSGETARTESPNKPKPETVTVDASKFNDVSRSDWFYNAVQYALENGLMNGTSDWAFSPNADTTRGMIVTILARLDGVNTVGNPWYAAGRTWAMNNGVSDGTNMEGKITREQLAAMLYRYAKAKGYDVSASADISGYTDASSASSWAVDAMRWAVGAGLINGRTATTLAPQGNATRAEVAAILMRFAQNIAK